MKKMSHYNLHIALLGLVLLLSSCVNTLELVTPRVGEQVSMTHQEAVSDAQRYFYSHFGSSTRSEGQQPSHEAPYVVGNIVPDWESGVTVSDNERAYTDFDIQKDYRFFLALEDEEQRIYGLELYSRLASVVDFGLEDMEQYVATYIPDIGFLSCYDYFVEEGLLTCEHTDWFTGVVLYTDLYGCHVAAYKYYDGTLVDSSFLYDAQKSQEENIADFVRVMKGISLFVAPESEGTRAIVAEDVAGGQIIYYYDDSGKLVWSYCQVDSITVTRPTQKPISLIGDDFVDIKTTLNDTKTIAPIFPSGGGGGSASTNKENKEEEDFEKELVEDLFDTKDLSPDDNKALVDMLSQILEDCMGKELLTRLIKQGKISISFNLESSIPSHYNHETKSIVMTNYYGDTLLHELFHAFQYSQIENVATYNLASANYEVEGQLARYIFLLRRQAYDTSGRYRTYCSTKLGKKIRGAGDMIDMQGNMYLDEQTYYNDYYKPSIDMVLQIAESKNLINISYDESLSMDQNLNNLKSVSIKCN